MRLLSGGDGTGREGQRVREQVWSKLEVAGLNCLFLCRAAHGNSGVLVKTASPGCSIRLCCDLHISHKEGFIRGGE